MPVTPFVLKPSRCNCRNDLPLIHRVSIPSSKKIEKSNRCAFAGNYAKATIVAHARFRVKKFGMHVDPRGGVLWISYTVIMCVIAIGHVWLVTCDSCIILHE